MEKQLQVETLHMLSSISFFEEIEKLFDRACGNRIAIYTVTD